MLTAAELKILFYYDGENLRNLFTKGRAKADDIAGTVNSKGYRQIKVNGKLYLAHRLVWVFHDKPLLNTDLLDHEDRNRLNNKIGNLRIATGTQNNLNRGLNATGITIQGNKFKVQFYYNCKRHYGGLFASLDEAVLAKEKMIKRLEA